jgi:hypothetical protein
MLSWNDYGRNTNRWALAKVGRSLGEIRCRIVHDRDMAGQIYCRCDIIFRDSLPSDMYEYIENREGDILRRVDSPNSPTIAAATGVGCALTAQVRILGADKAIYGHA